MNPTSSDTTLVTEKKKPFDVFAERPFLKTGRGDRRNFEPIVAMQPYVTTFLHRPEPYILRIASMMGATA